MPEPDLLLKIDIRLFDRSSYRLWGGRYCDGENWGGGGQQPIQVEPPFPPHFIHTTLAGSDERKRDPGEQW